MSGHRRSRCSGGRSAYGSSMPNSGGSSGTLSVGTPASLPSWVILSVVAARRDDFHGDHTTSATSRTHRGKEISASFELVEPPGISVLTVDIPGSTRSFDLLVLAADSDAVLFRMDNNHFVYMASSDPSRRPSLSLLPVHYEEEKSCSGRRHRRIINDETAILSCSSKESSSPAFIVADLDESSYGPSSEMDVYLYRSVSDDWKVYKNLHVHGANGGRDLTWWFADTAVPYRRRFLIWVDYYRGIIVADMSSQSEKKPLPPRLRYVPLPVDKVPDEDPYHIEHGRGCPELSRSLCATRSGIKFVSVDRQYTSNFGVGVPHMQNWRHTFRITTWSLRDGNYTWRRDATLYEREFWAVLDSQGRFPHVEPESPVVNMENPDAVSFLLREGRDPSDGPVWMVEVDMKKKALLAFTSYTNTSLSGDQQDTIMDARLQCESTFISSELSRYLDGGQGCKERRQ